MKNSFKCAPRSGLHEAGLPAEHRAFLRYIEPGHLGVFTAPAETQSPGK